MFGGEPCEVQGERADGRDAPDQLAQQVARMGSEPIDGAEGYAFDELDMFREVVGVVARMVSGLA